MIYLKKGAMGGYREVSEEAGFDLIALSHTEYNKIIDQARTQKSDNASLKKSIEAYKYKVSALQDEIDKLQKSNKAYAAQADGIEAKDERIREYELAVKKAEQKVKDAEALNENLLRVSRERANAAHKITPKKEKSGYKVKQTVERQASYPVKDKDGLFTYYTPYWETTILTPWDASLDEKLIRERIEEFVFDKFEDMGLQSSEERLYQESQIKSLFEYGDKCPQHSNKNYKRVFADNFVFFRKLQTNRGYWEMVIYHTHSLKNVWKLEDM